MAIAKFQWQEEYIGHLEGDKMRYRKESKGILDSQIYKNFLEKRGLKNATIYKTMSFGGLQDIKVEIRSYGFWTQGSSMHKISQELYGTIEYWWTIGLINSKPTDAHFSIGDEILIPVQPNIFKNKIGDY
jgi:hypothetical protein